MVFNGIVEHQLSATSKNAGVSKKNGMQLTSGFQRRTIRENHHAIDPAELSWFIASRLSIIHL
jgi:hypothetical protein